MSIFTDRTAAAMGLFDGVHRGHRAVIGEAVRLAEKLSVSPAVFTFETSTVSSKDGSANRIVTDSQKLELIRSMGVELIYSPPFDELKGLSAENFVKKILVERMNCAAVVCGSDFRFGRGAEGNCAVLRELCDKYSISLDVVPDEKYGGVRISSSEIRKLIADGNIHEANTLLGYDYYIKETVIGGHQLGRTMDFPTINQLIPDGMAVPKHGVYASETEIDGTVFRSVTNIGVKPTVEKHSALLAETHIIDYSGDLYGRVLKVSLFEFLRPEKKFADVSELFSQIAKDTEHSRTMKKI